MDQVVWWYWELSRESLGFAFCAEESPWIGRPLRVWCRSLCRTYCKAFLSWLKFSVFCFSSGYFEKWSSRKRLLSRLNFRCRQVTPCARQLKVSSTHHLIDLQLETVMPHAVGSLTKYFFHLCSAYFLSSFGSRSHRKYLALSQSEARATETP